MTPAGTNALPFPRVRVGTVGIAPHSNGANLLADGMLRYLFIMPRLVSYRIDDRGDGLFDAVATLAPDKTYRRAGFESLAAADEWIDGLRTLMAAIGAPLARAPDDPARPDAPAATETAGDRLRRFRDAISAAEDEAD